MAQFEDGKQYLITRMGYKSRSETIAVVRRTAKMIALVRVFNGRHTSREVERYKIRGIGTDNEYIIIFGGIVSDTVYASDIVKENEYE